MRKQTKGTIAAGHDKTAEAAAIILKEGGNAFDAAIAAFFASFITEPCMSSPGGGGFANIRQANGQTVLLDFFCQTPKQKRPIKEVEFYPMVVDFGSTTETFHIGMGSMATPGIIAGIYEIHERFGTIPMTVLAEPAIDLAKNGVKINDFQFFDIRVLEPILTKETESKNIFYPTAVPLPVGETLTMPGMAEYLYFLVREGRDEFYQGELAQTVVQHCQERGGFLTLEDFKEFQVAARQPLSFPYRGKTILTNPLPSIGGTLLGLCMRLLEKNNIDYSAFSPQHVQQLQTIVDKVFREERSQNNLNSKWGSTSHFNIVDEHNNAISITMSNGEGCGYMVPGTNVMMNNMLGEAALLPNGFHSWDVDTRLSSMMSPTLVLDAQKQFEIALGTGGASRIPAAIAQVLHYLIDFGFDVDTAVHAARLHNEHNELNLEPNFVGKHKDQDRLKVINWSAPSMFFGGVHTIQRKNNKLVGVGDTRREGFAMEV